MQARPACQATLNGGRSCDLPLQHVPERLLLVPPAQAQRDRCVLHRSDNRASRVLAILAERRHPLLRGVEAACPYWEVCGVGAPVHVGADGPGCVLEVEETFGLIVRYLDTLDEVGAVSHPLVDQAVADLVVRRLLLSRIEAHLATRGILEEIRTTGDGGERVTTGRASSLLRQVVALAQSIRVEETRLLPQQASSGAAQTDGRWLYVTEDRTEPEEPA